MARFGTETRTALRWSLAAGMDDHLDSVTTSQGSLARLNDTQRVEASGAHTWVGRYLYLPDLNWPEVVITSYTYGVGFGFTPAFATAAPSGARYEVHARRKAVYDRALRAAEIAGRARTWVDVKLNSVTWHSATYRYALPATLDSIARVAYEYTPGRPYKFNGPQSGPRPQWWVEHDYGPQLVFDQATVALGATETPAVPMVPAVPALGPPTGLVVSLGPGGALGPDADYWWQITAVNSQGETTPCALVQAHAFGGPTSLATVTWVPLSGATGYRIYRRNFNVGNPVGLVGTSAGPSFSDNGSVAPGVAPPVTDTTAIPSVPPVPEVPGAPILIYGQRRPLPMAVETDTCEILDSDWVIDYALAELHAAGARTTDTGAHLARSDRALARAERDLMFAIPPLPGSIPLR